MLVSTSTLRPGLLVALSSTVKGNVTINRKEIEAPHVEADGALVSLAEVERSVANPDEYDQAIKTRSKCRSLITGMCAKSTFGLLCPESKANELGDRIGMAQELAAEFNATAMLTRVSVYVIIGRVAQDDVQAVAAINSEVRDLMEMMETGINKLDAGMVRDAAARAKGLGSMLSADANSRVEEAIKVARSAARKIVKAAETGAAEIDQATLTKIRQARTAFLDLDVEASEIATPEATGRAIDLETEMDAQDAPGAPQSVVAPKIDLEEGYNLPPITARSSAPAMALDLD